MTHTWIIHERSISYIHVKCYAETSHDAYTNNTWLTHEQHINKKFRILMWNITPEWCLTHAWKTHTTSISRINWRPQTRTSHVTWMSRTSCATWMRQDTYINTLHLWKSVSYTNESCHVCVKLLTLPMCAAPSPSPPLTHTDAQCLEPAWVASRREAWKAKVHMSHVTHLNESWRGVGRVSACHVSLVKESLSCARSLSLSLSLALPLSGASHVTNMR